MFLSKGSPSTSRSPFRFHQEQPQIQNEPASLLTTMQTLLVRLQHHFQSNLHLDLPTPLAFLLSFTLSFLFVLSSVFMVFLLWRCVKGWGWSGCWR